MPFLRRVPKCIDMKLRAKEPERAGHLSRHARCQPRATGGAVNTLRRHVRQTVRHALRRPRATGVVVNTFRKHVRKTLRQANPVSRVTGVVVNTLRSRLQTLRHALAAADASRRAIGSVNQTIRSHTQHTLRQARALAATDALRRATGSVIDALGNPVPHILCYARARAVAVALRRATRGLNSVLRRHISHTLREASSVSRISGGVIDRLGNHLLQPPATPAPSARPTPRAALPVASSTHPAPPKDTPMPFLKRLLQTLRPNARNREIESEIALHIELRAEELERAGLPPREALRQARARFGSRARIAEETRETHLLAVADAWRRDSVYSIRALLRRPSFLATGLLTLALGIGVNIAIFSVLDGMLWKPLPVPAPDRLLAFVETRDGAGTGGNPIRLEEYTSAMTSLAAAGGFYGETVVTSTADGPQPLHALRTLGDVLGAFGYRPVLGRAFDAEEQQGRRGVALLSYRFWQQQFGGRVDALGRTLNSRGGPMEIIGVLGPDASVIEDYDIWSPMKAETPDNLTPRTAGYLMCIARLRPGVSEAAAGAELATISAAIRAANPVADHGLAVRFRPLRDVLAGQAFLPFYLLAAVVFTVLLIACANIAGLLLARNQERAREASIRAAIGAGRWDLFRLYLLEALWLALPGGALGLLTGAWTLSLLKPAIPADLPLLANIGIDLRASFFAAALTVFCALAIGLLPAWQLARLRFTRHPLRGTLVVAQVSLSLVLLLLTAFLLQGLRTAQRRPLGFQPDHVLALQFDFPWDTDGTKLRHFYAAAEDALRTMPGVRAAGTVDRIPLQGGSQQRAFIRLRGRDLDDALARQRYGYRAVTNGYFTALRIPLLAGRLPVPGQRETLVNETFARTHFGAAGGVGESVSFTGPEEAPIWYRVTGIVADIAHSAVDLRTFSEVFVPFERTFWPSATIILQMEGDPAAFAAAARQRIRQVDPFALLRYAGPLDARLDSAWSEPRLLAKLLSGLAFAALALVSIGIYGLLSGFVRSRTREFGIRLALGATPRSLTQLSLNHGLRLTSLGLALGLGAAVPAVRLFRGLIPGGESPHPAVATAAALLLLAAALAACYIPARRAARLDPAAVLRHE